MASDGTRGPVPILGLAADDPRKPPIRLELRQMSTSRDPLIRDQWNLYLLGIEAFTKKDENSPLSYFQISGIHGQPYQPWPNQPWNAGTPHVKIDPNTGEATEQQQWGGYCTHSSILFLTWHRPFLSLFETTLYNIINQIAQSYTDPNTKARYVKAARTFRMPYWDWALESDNGIGLFPREALTSTIHSVVRPGGGRDRDFNDTLRPNPLASYKFGTESQGDERIDQFGNGRTIRYAVRARDRSLKPDEQSLQDTFAQLPEDEDPLSGGNLQFAKGKNLTERTLFVLQSYKNFAGMSYNQFSGMNLFTYFGGFEDIHNSIHGYVGGRGHMSDPRVSAFDPIFWLHHTNIDRLFAIWQGLYDNVNNPSTFVQEKPAFGGGTFTTKWGTNRALANEGPKTPLSPFNRSDKVGDFWNSEQVRSTKTFGYAYPETDGPKDIFAELKKLYPKASLANGLMATGPARKEIISGLQARAASHQLVAETPLNTETLLTSAQTAFAPQMLLQTAVQPAPPAAIPESITAQATDIKLPSNRSIDNLAPDGKYLEWLINIKAAKHSLGGDFLVHFFLGDPDDAQPHLYVANPTHVGAFSTFGQDEKTKCAKCLEGQAANLQVTGQIPLTVALVERYLAGHVGGIRLDDVVPFLQTHLHWRVISLDGERLHRGDVRDLLVTVVTNEVTLPGSEGEMPVYAEDVVARPEITQNREGQGRGMGTGYTGGDISVGA